MKREVGQAGSTMIPSTQRAVSGRRLVLAAMVFVTAWSLAAWAQPAKHKAEPGGAGAAHTHRESTQHHDDKSPGHAEPKASASANGPAPEVKAAAPEAKGAAPEAKHAAPAEAAGAASAEPKGASSEEKPEEAEGAAPAPMNLWTFGGATPPFVASLINFAILAAGFYWLGRKPVAASLKNRRDTIAKEIDEAQAMKHEAEERAKVYQAKLSRLEDEVRGMREALLQSGQAESERLVREAEAKAERMRKDAEFLVEQELKQIRENLWREAVEAAVASAEHLLRERVTPADQERLAEDFLADLGRSKKPAENASGAAS